MDDAAVRDGVAGGAVAARRRRARLIWGGGVLLVATFLVYAFWPRPAPVETALVDRGDVRVEIVDEGRTRYHDVYVVSAPASGRVLRVDVEPGDVIEAGSRLAQMTPAAAGFLDPRSDAQARATVDAAAASVRVARARADLADREYSRALKLREQRLVAEAAVDQARAQLDADRAALAAAQAELERARSALLRPAATVAGTISVRSPATGVVLRVPQESESIVSAGTPLVEVGDPSRIEVVVEFLSQDAVRMRAGSAATVEGWGGPPLAARVQRVEPVARTKVSALGVEEQRTNVIMDFVNPGEAQRLGHDYRIDARVVIESTPDAVRAPNGALFRFGDDWAVFRVKDGRAVLTPVEAGPSDENYRSIRRGLEPGSRVIVYPGTGIADGSRVQPTTTERTPRR